MKRLPRTLSIICLIIILIGLVIFIAWSDHISNRDKLINNNLSYMQLNAITTSNNIQNYFNEHLEQLLIITKNESFRREVLKCASQKHKNHSDCILNTLYQININDIDEVFLVDNSNKIYYSSSSEYGKYEKDYFDNIIIEHDTTHSPYLSISLIKNEPEIFLTVPIINNETIEYSISILFKSNTIFTNSLKSLNNNDTEFWLIDQAGTVISHPIAYHLGKNYVELHKTKYPNVDWSELEGHIESMLTGKSGSGIFSYHKNLNSLSQSQKKFIAYAPVFILDKIWYVGVTRHYSELELLTNSHTIKTFSLTAILILLFVFGSFILYKSKNKRQLLEVEAESLREKASILKALEQSTDSLLESQKIAQIGSYVLDIKNGKWKSSDVLNDIFGINNSYKTDMEGWINVIHPDYRNTMIDYITKVVFTENKEFDKEYPIIRVSDKTERWVHGRGKIEFDDQNNPIRMNGVIQDITERKLFGKRQSVLYNITKQAHENKDLNIFLKNVHDELSTLMKVKNLYVALYHPEHNKYTFPYYVDQYDIKHNPNELVELKNSRTDYVRRTLKSQIITKKDNKKLIQTDEIELIGTPSLIYLGSPLLDVNGKAIGVIGIQDYESADAYTDKDLELLDFVSRNIGSLVEKINVEQVLKLSEERIELALNGANLAYWDWNIITNELIFNDRWLEMVGYKRGEVDVNGWTWSEWIHHEDLQKTKDLLDENLDGKTNSYSAEYRVRTKTDKWIWISDQGKVFRRDKNDKPIRMAGTRLDITERKNHEIELIKAKEKAEEGDRLKTSFLNNISHEIRTPLNGIMGFSKMLNEPHIADIKREEFTKYIMLSGNRLLKIVDDVLIISKIETEQVNLIKKETCVNTLLKDLLTVFKPIASIKDINMLLNNQLSDELSTIITDEIKLRQILYNLLDNSIKFTQKGSVEFGYVLKNKVLEFYVTDTGIGIDSKLQNVIFERFRQVETDLSRQYGGTGLGLTISKAYVEFLGGNIWLTSKPLNGSSFYFTIPYVVSAKTKDINSGNDTPGKLKVNWKNKTILIVEDNYNNYQLIAEVLGETKINILHAKTGSEAIEYCNKLDINLILMDIRLPDITGYEVTKIVKNSFKNVPVIAQTAYSLPEDEERAMDAGCDDFISKPINMHELMNILNKFLT